jgi:hypothetical protein
MQAPVNNGGLLNQELIELNTKSYEHILAKSPHLQEQSKAEHVKRYFIALITNQ